MKKSYIIQKHINPTIKVGDKVRIFDGSGFSISDYEEDAYIVFPYPKLFGNDLEVKEMEFTVVSINETDRIIQGGGNNFLLQDLILKAPNGKIVFSSSSFVKLYTKYTPIELAMENCFDEWTNEILDNGSFEDEYDELDWWDENILH